MVIFNLIIESSDLAICLSFKFIPLFNGELSLNSKSDYLNLSAERIYLIPMTMIR